jgi:hypothetical protein
VADDLWHELILYTKNYQQFCDQAFGRFLHHTPAVVLSKGQRGNAGIRRCWRYVCMEENINPHAPTRLPLLFALDSKLHIAGGFHYVADCQGARRQNMNDSGATTYCGADLGVSDSSGSDSGSGCGADGDIGGSDSGDSGGSDGCGGGGCGGGGD